MRVIKIIGGILLLLLACLLIAAVVAPKNVEVKRSTKIKAPPAAVFPHLQYIDKMVAWHPWFSKDPALLTGVSGQDGQVGAVRRWDSQNREVGAGEETILEMVENGYLKTEIDIFSPRKAKGVNQFSLVDADLETQVIWQFSYEVPFPFNALLLFGNSDLGPMEKQFAQGLQSLKQLIENFEKSQVNYIVGYQDVLPETFMVRRDTLPFNQLNVFSQNTLEALVATRESMGLKRAGFPVGLIYSWDRESDQVDFAFGIPVSTTAGLENETLVELGSQSDVSTIFVNEQTDDRKKAHGFMVRHFSGNGDKILYPIVEKFFKGPLSEGNEAHNGIRLFYLKQS